MEDCFETTSNKVYSCVDLISSSTEPCLLFLSVRAVRTNSRTSFPVATDDNDALLSLLAVDSAGQAVWRLPGPGSDTVSYIWAQRRCQLKPHTSQLI